MEWIKLYIRGSLRGSIRFDLTPAERSVWYELLLLAGESRTAGKIQAGEGQPYPTSYLAGLLGIPEALLLETMQKCEKAGRLKVNAGAIHIINWDKYQSKPFGK